MSSKFIHVLEVRRLDQAGSVDIQLPDSASGQAGST